jgi:hypothetical protein
MTNLYPTSYKIWKNEVISSKSGMRPGYPLSPLFFNVVLEFLVRAVGGEKETKGIQMGKEKAKLSLFAGNMILHLKNPKTSTKEILALINTLSKSSRIQNQHINIIVFLCTNKLSINRSTGRFR